MGWSKSSELKAPQKQNGLLNNVVAALELAKRISQGELRFFVAKGLTGAVTFTC